MNGLSIAPHTSTPSSALPAGAAPPAPRAVWAGRVVSGLAVAFLVFDALIKVVELAPAVESTIELGYPASAVPIIGWIQVACLVAYLVPRTSVLGAVLWTGYLGGAIATHFRVGNPLFSHTLFPVYVAAMLWGGLWLRSPELRALVRTITRPSSPPASDA